MVVLHASADGVEERHELEAQVQAKKAFFDVDAPVYQGDRMELRDPRGGTRLVWITDVKINQAGGTVSSFMSHIAATFVEKEPAPREIVTNQQIVHGDAIIVSGDHVNIATRGSSVTQQSPVTAGYEGLAKAVKQALELIDADKSIDPAERITASDASKQILEELTSDEPDQGKLRGSLTVLRGVLVAGANSAAAAVASGLVQQLLLASN